MKKSIIGVILSSLLLILITVSCNLLPGGGGTPKTLSAEDAKVEIRAANQELIAQTDLMLEAPGMASLTYMYELMYGTALKSATKTTPIFSRQMTYSKALNMFRNDRFLKSAKVEDDDDFYGILDYDFTYGDFELVEESNSMMQMNYPADDVAFANQENNAQLTISDLEFDEITSYYEEYNWETDSYEKVPSTESIPVSAKVNLLVDNVEALTAEYDASYNSEGMPLSMSAEMESGDYSFSMSFSGSGSKYNSKLEYKIGNDDLMGYDFDIEYTSDMETVKSIDGYYLFSPLKFEGSADVDAISNYGMETDETLEEIDLTYLNSLMDIEVIQAEQNSKIGVLEYQMYYDAVWGESYPAIAIVYDDGTYEWLDEVMTITDEIEY